MKLFSPDMEPTAEIIRVLERRAKALEYDLYHIAADARLAGEQHIEDDLEQVARDLGPTFDALEALRSRFPIHSPMASARAA
jgi:hypothetical protein